MPTASSSFTVEQTTSAPVDWVGGELARTRFDKLFSGDLAGTGVVEATMLRQPDGLSVYVGVERITGALAGRQGSFLLLHSAVASGSGQQASWTIVDSSGTGELAGISGSGQILPDHQFTLEYTLGD